MPQIHHLKTYYNVYQEVLAGRKKFEYRFNDRDFKVGDALCLHCLVPTGHYTKEMTYLMCNVTYVLYGPAFGVPENYCVMSIDVTSYTNPDPNDDELLITTILKDGTN